MQNLRESLLQIFPIDSEERSARSSHEERSTRTGTVELEREESNRRK